jgi:hypothetical protein
MEQLLTIINIEMRGNGRMEVSLDDRRHTVTDFDGGAHIPISNNLASIIATFQEAGIEFIRENGVGVGVRFQKPIT